MDNQARLQDIYDEAGRPGAKSFRFQVRRAGLEISEAEAKAFVAAQSQGQFSGKRLQAMAKSPAAAKTIAERKLILLISASA